MLKLHFSPNIPFSYACIAPIHMYFFLCLCLRLHHTCEPAFTHRIDHSRSREFWLIPSPSPSPKQKHTHYAHTCVCAHARMHAHTQHTCTYMHAPHTHHRRTTQHNTNKQWSTNIWTCCIILGAVTRVTASALYSTAVKDPILTIPVEGSKVTAALWGPLDQYLITGHENGDLCQWDMKVCYPRVLFLTLCSQFWFDLDFIV